MIVCIRVTKLTNNYFVPGTVLYQFVGLSVVLPFKGSDKIKWFTIMKKNISKASSHDPLSLLFFIL